MNTRTTRTDRGTPRSSAPEATPPPVSAPPRPSYARGNPLTHSVTFTDASGTCWLVYVEPAPPEPALWPNAAVLPGRRLRFDSLDLSLTASPVPAGAPFLQERTLQALLDKAQSVEAPQAHHRITAPPSGSHRAASVQPPVPGPQAEPVRAQLTGIVNSPTGLTYGLSRLAEPFALLLMLIRDTILPRGRG